MILRKGTAYMKKKMLITGCGGFVAQEILSVINYNLYEIYGLARSEIKDKRLKQTYKIDITKEFFLDEEFDVVLHLAAYNRTHIGAACEYEPYYQVNVLGTRNVIHSCTFKKFVFFSSATVYDTAQELVTESGKIALDSYYARSKYEAEEICRKWIPESKRIILRWTNIVGVAQNHIALLPVIFENALSDKDIHIFAPRNRVMQLLDVKDVANLLMLIMEGDLSGTYNVANDDCLTIEELTKQVVHMCKSDSKIIFSCEERELPRIISSEKLKAALGSYTYRPIDKILNDFLEKGKSR